jgi:hypothetical protein
MATLGFQCRFSDTGSISAPARKVSAIEPTPARKVMNSVSLTCSLIPVEGSPRRPRPGSR